MPVGSYPGLAHTLLSFRLSGIILHLALKSVVFSAGLARQDSKLLRAVIASADGWCIRHLK
jgi:hypothetical protein